MSGAHLSRLAGYLSGRPLMMEPHAVKAAFEAIAPRLSTSALEIGAEADGPTMAERKRSAAMQRLATIVEAEAVEVGDGMGEYAVTPEGVAVVSVVGSLVNRFDWLSALCGLVSYDSLGLTLDTALADPRVKAILLDIDSPGGEAAGMLDLADRIRAASQTKPVWASANSLAASAGYGIAAAANRLTLPRLGCVGSIGVVAVHIDQSAADKERGLKFTALYSGARKVDGWGHATLSPDARERFQGQLDAAREKFAGAVATFRGLPRAAVLATEAAVYDDDEAVAEGLADAVQPFAETLAELTDLIRRPGGSSLGGPAARTSGNGGTMPKDSKAAESKAADDEKDKPGSEKPDEGDDAKKGKAEGEKDDDKAEDEEEGKDARAAAAEIAALCAEAGVPQMAAPLIREGASLADAKARIDQAGKVRAAVQQAHKINAGAVPLSLADEYIGKGMGLDAVRSALFGRLADAQSPEIAASVTDFGKRPEASAPVIDTAAIYAARRKSATAR